MGALLAQHSGLPLTLSPYCLQYSDTLWGTKGNQEGQFIITHIHARAHTLNITALHRAGSHDTQRTQRTFQHIPEHPWRPATTANGAHMHTHTKYTRERYSCNSNKARKRYHRIITLCVICHIHNWLVLAYKKHDIGICQ